MFSSISYLARLSDYILKAGGEVGNLIWDIQTQKMTKIFLDISKPFIHTVARSSINAYKYTYPSFTITLIQLKSAIVTIITHFIAAI